MRYYSLALSGGAGGSYTWSSHPNGIQQPPDPGALDIEFDFVTTFFDTPAGGAGITLRGVGLDLIAKAPMFCDPNNPSQIVLRAGMGKGLPLANPAQAGAILVGTVNQCFGNWVGTDMTLDFIVLPSKYTTDSPGNIVLYWETGTTLSSALSVALKTAFPGMKQNITVSPDLVNTAAVAQAGAYPTLEAFATALDAITGGAVSIWITAGQIYASDFSSPANPIQLAFTDLVGQPTWWGPNELQFKTVMRADIGVGATVKMPPGLQNAPGIVSTSAASLPAYSKYKSAFQGNFEVVQIEQVGSFRNPDGANGWTTVFNAIVPAST